MEHEWYRAWRHRELDREERMARDVSLRRREAAKRIIGDLCIIGAIMMFGWSMMPY